jgi:hypothetical protein
MSGLIDLDLEESQAKAIIPPWTLWKRKAKDVEKEEWFNNTLPVIEKLSQTRIETYVNNLLWYTGEYEKTLEYRLVVPGRGDQELPRRMLPRIFNHLFDITEQRVSRLSRYKPNFDTAPTNKEDSDRVIARLLKICIEAVNRRINLDFMMQELERWVAVFGMVLTAVEWNTWLGDRQRPGSIERIGDVDVYLKEPWTIFPEPKRRWDDVKYAIDIWDIAHVEEARVIFDDKTIEPDGKRNIFSFNDTLIEKREDELPVYRLIQLPTQFLPEGGVTYFANKKIVREEEKFPYSHGEFPWEVHTDIDVPGRLFPMSFYQHLQPVQHVYNRLTSVMVRNLLLTGHPHILNPMGSGAKRESFGNAPTEIKFRPVQGMRPEILTFKSVPQEFFQFRDGVKQELGEVAGTQNALRGDPPSGTRAASMLRWYEEQQEQRMSTTILKHNDLVRRICKKVGSVIGDYYPVEEGAPRLIRTVGADNQYLIEEFKAKKISSEYDVIIINSTGFSQMMSGRLEEISLITDMEKQTGQQILTPQEKADILEIKNPQKAYDILTSSLKTAEMYNEYFLAGREVPAPEEYWDLLTHWRTLMILLNSPQWHKVPAQYKTPALDHLMAMEMLMERKALKNQAFQQKLMALEGYPAVFEPTPQPAPGAGAPPPPGAGPMPEMPPGGMPPEMGMPGMPPDVNPADLSTQPMPPPPMGPGAVQ